MSPPGSVLTAAVTSFHWAAESTVKTKARKRLMLFKISSNMEGWKQTHRKHTSDHHHHHHHHHLQRLRQAPPPPVDDSKGAGRVQQGALLLVHT